MQRSKNYYIIRKTIVTMKEKKGLSSYYKEPFTIPERTIERTTWKLEEPELVVPDQEDSIESLVARQRAGLKMEFSHLQKRFYPTDPNQLLTAKKLIDELGKQAEEKYNAQMANIAEAEVAAAKIKAVKVQREKEYDAWVKDQEKLKSSK